MKAIYKQIAAMNNTEASEVESEIARAIELAMSDGSESAKAFWSQIAADGTQPSNEAVINAIITTLVQQLISEEQ